MYLSNRKYKKQTQSFCFWKLPVKFSNKSFPFSETSFANNTV